jgi:hypothetical protein
MLELTNNCGDLRVNRSSQASIACTNPNCGWAVAQQVVGVPVFVRLVRPSWINFQPLLSFAPFFPLGRRRAFACDVMYFPQLLMPCVFLSLVP